MAEGKAERLLRDIERQIMAQESCGVCARDHNGCYVGESLRIVRSALAAITTEDGHHE